MLNQRLLKVLLATSIVLLLSAWVSHATLQGYLDSPLPIADRIVLEVQPGSSMMEVSNQLQLLAGLDKPRLFRLWARYNGHDTALKAGEFELSAGMTPRTALQHLVSGPTVQYQVTFIEGHTVRQALDTLWSSRRVTVTLREAGDEEILAALQSPFPSLEGILFPDTYFYTAGATDLSILRRAASRLEEVLAQEWTTRASGLPYMTPYEALIMASIIEKESGLASEREQIAGVFTRRLQSGMRLQSDPTVIYGMGEAYDGNIRRVDLETTTAYNTYRISGLPPTPIAMAGQSALHASMHPAEGSFMYFVARGDGGHQFSNTLEEHNAAVRQYQLGGSR